MDDTFALVYHGGFTRACVQKMVKAERDGMMKRLIDQLKAERRAMKT